MFFFSFLKKNKLENNNKTHVASGHNIGSTDLDSSRDHCLFAPTEFKANTGLSSR